MLVAIAIASCIRNKKIASNSLLEKERSFFSRIYELGAESAVPSVENRRGERIDSDERLEGAVVALSTRYLDEDWEM